MSDDTNPPTAGTDKPVILVVEDDAAVREATVWVLGLFGYATREAANGPAALEVLAAEPDIAVMFSDVVMPKGMNGIELAAEARRRRPDLKVVLTTGYSQADLDLSLLSRGDTRLIAKPYSNDELDATLKALLRD